MQKEYEPEHAKSKEEFGSCSQCNRKSEDGTSRHQPSKQEQRPRHPCPNITLRTP
jgi:hypothetical protein